jgi:L-lactate utilization protein LutC
MSESGNRVALIGHLRDRLSGGIPTSEHRPLRVIADSEPRAELVPTGMSPAGAFTLALESVAGRVAILDGTATSVEDFVAEVCRVEGVERAVVTGEPECEGIAALLTRRGVEAAPYGSIEQAATADLGVTSAAYGIAFTGTVIVDAGRAGGRCASLLPRVHVCLLPIARLLPTMADLLRHLGDRLPGGLPSNLVAITGPSRSADIELHMTLGVHGPRSLWVGLLP